MNTKSAYCLGVGFVLLILALLLVPRFFGQHHPSPSAAIGKIDSVQGSVTVRLARTLEFKPAKAGDVLYSQEVVVVDQGEAVLSLETQTQLKVLEATKFVVENDATRADALAATVLEGQVIVMNAGAPEKFRLYRQGRELPLDRAILNQPNVVKPARIPKLNGITITATVASESTDETAAAPVKPAPGATPDQASAEVLTNDDIVRQLRGQSGFFQRCYLAYINRVRGDKASVEGGFTAQTPLAGVVALAFKVQSTGRVTEARMVRSDFKDPILHRCLVEVVERARFKPFSGDAVPVLEFPIRLQ